jgi:hypothetical protein
MVPVSVKLEWRVSVWCRRMFKSTVVWNRRRADQREVTFQSPSRFRRLSPRPPSHSCPSACAVYEAAMMLNRICMTHQGKVRSKAKAMQCIIRPPDLLYKSLSHRSHEPDRLVDRLSSSLLLGGSEHGWLSSQHCASQWSGSVLTGVFRSLRKGSAQHLGGEYGHRNPSFRYSPFCSVRSGGYWTLVEVYMSQRCWKQVMARTLTSVRVGVEFFGELGLRLLQDDGQSTRVGDVSAIRRRVPKSLCVGDESLDIADHPTRRRVG